MTFCQFTPVGRDRWLREQNLLNARQPANAHRRVLAVGNFVISNEIYILKSIIFRLSHTISDIQFHNYI